MKLHHCLLPVILAVATPGLAQTTIISPSPDQQADNKILCKSEASTGSRFATRVCHTNKEWADIREQSMREVHDIDKTKFGSDSLHSEYLSTLSENHGPQ